MLDGAEIIQGETRVIDVGGSDVGGQDLLIKTVIEQGAPIISRSFYIHGAPEEDQSSHAEEKIIQSRAHKNYKIIFIKGLNEGGSFGGTGSVNFPKVCILVLFSSLS